MTNCKVAVIGAGSYVFGPSVLNDAILTHQLPGLELDPTILDKRAGCAAIDACIQAHADLLPAYH
jgi:hypothetical protein